jgi:predicted esterase
MRMGRLMFSCIVGACFVCSRTGFAQSLVAEPNISDQYEGRTLLWRAALYSDQEISTASMSSIHFALLKPVGYSSESQQKYPLVLYLHGAGARGSSIRNVVQRQSPRYFAWQARTIPKYAAFVVAPQVPSGLRYVDVDWVYGPYVQSDATHTDPMRLTEALIGYLTTAGNNPTLNAVLGIDANHIDLNRIYVVGDSMGAYGTWDTVGRNPGLYAAAIAASGSGPKNKLGELQQTPFWAIHGSTDSTVPNALPSSMDPDGAGSLGMLALIDPAFDNTTSTELIRLDDYSLAGDDPNLADTLIYSEVPGFDHATVAVEWTIRVSGALEWLFAHGAPQKTSPDINGDRKVDANDLQALLGHWLDHDCEAVFHCGRTDLNGDGQVNWLDFAILAEQWGVDESDMPVAWWAFDESAGFLAYDSIADKHGVLIGMDEASHVPGRFDNALDFDGRDDYVLIPHLAPEDFTIVFWVRTSTTGTSVGRSIQWYSGTGLIDGTVQSSEDDFGITLADTKVAFGARQQDGQGLTLVSASSVVDNQWHFVAAIRNAQAGDMALFVDNAMESSAIGPTGPKDAPAMLNIGSLQTHLDGRYFRGQIDDVRIYDRVLGEHELMALAQVMLLRQEI